MKKKRFNWLTALFAVASLLFAGCHKIDSGVVIDKRIVLPSKTYVNCGGVMLPLAGSETYKVVLRNGDITESFYVLEKVYYSVEIGDTLKIEGVIIR